MVAKYILGLLATILLSGVVVTGIPLSDFVFFRSGNLGLTSSSTPASLTLATAVSLPMLNIPFTVVEALQSGRLRFVSSGQSYEIFNLGFLSSEFGLALTLVSNTDATELAAAGNLVQRVFPDDSPASFTPTVGVSLSSQGPPATVQTVFVSDGTLSFLLLLQADGLVGSVNNNLLQVEFLSSGEMLGSGITLFRHPNSGAGLDDVELQSNGCIPGLYALRLDSASLVQTPTQPVTRLIPELSLRQFENIPNIMVCVRSCGSAGIIDNDIRVDYETADGTARSAARDYRRSRGTLVFNIGDTSMCARFTIRDDTDDELNENFFIDWTNLDFSNADDREYQLTRARTTVTIRDNDLPRRRPRYCWICTRRQWMRNRRLCLYSIRIICGYTFPVTNTG